MTQMIAPEILESTIVISNARKDVLTAAMSGARQAMETTAQLPWEAFHETPAQQRANARARRIAWLAESF